MEKFKLGELLKVRRGTSLSGDYYSESGTLIRLTLGNFNYPGGGFKDNTSKKDIYFTGPVKKEYILNKGDMITPLTEQVAGLLGETARIPCDNRYIQSGDIGLVITNPSKIDNHFAYYLISSIAVRRQLSAGAQQTKIRHTSPEAIENCTVYIPTKLQQSRIGKLLDCINEKITTNNRINDNLQQLAKTIYDYWFIQFDFPDENGKPYRSSGGKMVWNESLKCEIPEGWKVVKAGECIEHINTGLNPRDNFVLGDGKIRYLTVKNLTFNGNIDWNGCDRINENARALVHQRSDVSKGDILFASISPLGRCFLVLENPKDWDINESVFSIRPNQNKLSTEYLYMYLTSDYFIKTAEHNSTGSVFSGIRISALENMYMVLPDKVIMDSFTKMVKTQFNKKYSCMQENWQLTELRNWLLPMLMNGQATVTD